MLNTIFIFAGYGVSTRAVRDFCCYGKAICGAWSVINVANVTNLAIIARQESIPIDWNIYLCKHG
jgi:hypothetical protein